MVQAPARSLADMIKLQRLAKTYYTPARDCVALKASPSLASSQKSEMEEVK
jgi:hypothetical protein